MLLRETRVRPELILLAPLLLRVDVPLTEEEERRLPPLVTPAEFLLDELLRSLLNEVADDAELLAELEDLEDLKEDDLFDVERLLRLLL